MKKLLYLFMTIVAIAMISCEPEEDPIVPETKKTAPVVNTVGISEVTLTSVTAIGKIISDGGSTISSKGILWSATNQYPNLSDNKIALVGNDSIFAAQLTGLIPGTKYYARAYATNNLGSTFGIIVSFTTTGGMPQLSPVKVVSGVLSASLSVKVNANGLTTGIIFDYGYSPDSLSSSVVAEPNLMSDFKDTTVSAKIDGLEPGVHCYVRARATNDAGTKTSAVVDFTYDAVKDIDGNLYKAIKIGNQVWLAENLKVTHYNDGTAIPNVIDSVAWTNLTTGAYCNYDNDASYVATYGRLYNWYVASSSKLAPKGWHVPTNEDWNTLYLAAYNAYCNGDDGSTVGCVLKTPGTTDWAYPNFYSNNKSGFTALPAGGRFTDGHIGTFDDLHKAGAWWSTSEAEGRAFIKFVLSERTDFMMNYINLKTGGVSIRLVKD